MEKSGSQRMEMAKSSHMKMLSSGSTVKSLMKEARPTSTTTVRRGMMEEST